MGGGGGSRPARATQMCMEGKKNAFVLLMYQGVMTTENMTLRVTRELQRRGRLQPQHAGNACSASSMTPLHRTALINVCKCASRRWMEAGARQREGTPWEREGGSGLTMQGCDP